MKTKNHVGARRKSVHRKTENTPQMDMAKNLGLLFVIVVLCFVALTFVTAFPIQFASKSVRSWVCPAATTGMTAGVQSINPALAR